MAGKILEFTDLAVEFVPVKVSRMDEHTSATTTVTLMAYKNGPRCPVTKKVELAQIRRTHIEMSREEGIETGMSTIALASYVREVILAMVQGITPFEADLIAADDDRTIEVMVYLGMWKESEEEQDASQGEVNADQ